MRAASLLPIVEVNHPVKGTAVPTLRLLPAGSRPAEQTGELLCCAYTADGAFLLTGGWDGHLRLWETGNGSHVTAFRASDKPVAACATSPDGKNLVSGSLEGMLTVWDALTHQQKVNFLAHTRPISGIQYGYDGRTIATTSWDNSAALWASLRTRDAKTLAGHKDIVAGCRFTPDAQSLLTWSHDSQVLLWDVNRLSQIREYPGHTDRVLTGSISADGIWAATGARDGGLKLWDVQAATELAAGTLPFEVRGCLFLLDGQWLVAVDKHGRMTLHSLPNLHIQGELITRQPVQCADLSPTGGQIALALTNGNVRFVAIDGFDAAPLTITATRHTRRTATKFQKLFGRSQLVFYYQCQCPACRHPFELAEVRPGLQTPCPSCKRQLRLNSVVRTATEP